jgi:HK97 family phage major capsid protein
MTRPENLKATDWIRGTLLGDKEARERCLLSGMTKGVVEGTNVAGGFLVPTVFGDQIIALRELYGSIRQNARVLNIKGDSIAIPRRNAPGASTTTGAVTGQFTQEAVAITESTATAYDQIMIQPVKFTGLVRLSSELVEDSGPDLASFLVDDFAQVFAKQEDDCGWSGDGSATYARMRGITQLMVDSNHNAAKVAAASTHKTFATLDSGDLANLMAALPAYAWNNAKWYCSAFAWATCFLRLAGASGAFVGSVNGQPTYLGRPVVFTQSLPATSADFSTKIMIGFGDLKQSTILASARDFTMARSNDRYMDQDQIAFRATERFYILSPNLGTDGGFTGPLVGLQGTT